MEKSSCYPKQGEWIFWSGIRGWKRRHKGRYITTSMWCIFCIIYPKLNVSICVYMNKHVIYLHATISIFRWSDTCPSLSVSILYAPHRKNDILVIFVSRGYWYFKRKLLALEWQTSSTTWMEKRSLWSKCCVGVYEKYRSDIRVVWRIYCKRCGIFQSL